MNHRFQLAIVFGIRGTRNKFFQLKTKTGRSKAANSSARITPSQNEHQERRLPSPLSPLREYLTPTSGTVQAASAWVYRRAIERVPQHQAGRGGDGSVGGVEGFRKVLRVNLHGLAFE